MPLLGQITKKKHQHHPKVPQITDDFIMLPKENDGYTQTRRKLGPTMIRKQLGKVRGRCLEFKDVLAKTFKVDS